MAPKNKAKKGKKQDDEEYWDTIGQPAGDAKAGSPAVEADAADEFLASSSSKKKKMTGFSAAALDMDDMAGGGEGGEEAEEGEDFGGLMSTLKLSKAKPKKEKKKAKKGWEEDEDVGATPAADQDAGADENAEGTAASKAPVEMTAEELADEEWGPTKEKKGKKGKKGKDKKGAKKDDDEDVEEEKPPAAEATTAAGAAPEAADAAEDDADGDGDAGPKVLSKKEKEKLKKEKEKAKKKAQAAAKKATTGDGDGDGATTEAPAATPAPPAAAEAPKDEDGDDGDDAAEGGAASKNKKKKKKAKKEDEPAPTPTAKKVGGKLGALKAAMEEKRRLEEEARKAEEERLRAIEEEEKRFEEEEKRKEAEKQRKKEREKAKIELAKKEGRYMTKKQKEDHRLAELRKQALLASGVQVEGLVAGGSGAPANKKVSYGNRKKDNKKGSAGAAVSGSKDASPAPSSPATPAVSTSELPATPQPEPEAAPKEPEEDRDEWDASSDDEAAKATALVAADVKDDWDASSGEEGAAKPAAPLPKAEAEKAKAPKSKPAKANGATAKTALQGKPATAPAKAATTKPGPDSKPTSKPAAIAKESSSEEESDEDDDDSEEDSDDDSDDDDDSSEDEDGMTATQRAAAQKKAEAAERRAKAHEAALAARSKDNLRSPICCILGHVDTGKTKLLDKIRQTNVQEGEAGGITQQIGATFFPVDAIKQKTQVLNKDGKAEYNIPGLLVIDTPGHESFSNLRTRGSSLCNIAILVVDIMHGLEPQTLESLRLLRDRKTPFIVALNKIDRMYGWTAVPDNGFQDSLAKQAKSVQREFEDRVARTITAFAEQGLNAVLYYDNKNLGRNVSLVPTSAITGEGIPDMIMLLVNLTQQRMNERLMYLSSLECTVLEVKVIEGLGTTIDVVLVNGYLREGDKIVVCGLNGAIVTQVRALLTPQPLRELRIKSQYIHHKEVKAALGVKISAPDLDKAIAGSRLLVCGPDDDEDDMREEVMSDLTSLLSFIDKTGRGVSVQASTLGSLEALLDFLKVSKIPVSGINIGPVHRKDIMRCAVMLDRARELAVMLCFDVPVDKDAERMADELGIKVFKADIIYHLFDAFTAYNAEVTEAKRQDAAPKAVWPCRLKIIACFAKRDPIILGMDILDGSLRVGTPLCVVKVDPVTQKREIHDLGKITSLEINHKSMDVVKKSQAGGGVAVKIEHASYQSAKMFGRHFDDKDEVISHVTRASIDVLKATFKADVTTEEWLLIKALKPRLGVQ